MSSSYVGLPAIMAYAKDALLGGVISAGMYSLSAVPSGNWNIKDALASFGEGMLDSYAIMRAMTIAGAGIRVTAKGVTKLINNKYVRRFATSELGEVKYVGGKGAKGGKNIIQPYEVTTYDNFRVKSTVGDGLEGHEIWQHANLNENGYATTRLSTDASKNNIVITLPHKVHMDVNKMQYSLNAKMQKTLENIKSNANILYSHNKVPNGQVDKALRLVTMHYNRIKK